MTTREQQVIPDEDINVDWQEVERLYLLRLEYYRPESTHQSQRQALTIPNSYTRHNPLECDGVGRANTLPEGVDSGSTVKVIMRSGRYDSGLANRFSWGDGDELGDSAIVAYRAIKVARLWIDWGNRFPLRSLQIEPVISGVPDNPALEGNPLVKVWLRNERRPQRFAQHVNQWHWGLNGTTNDIMKYRLLHEGEL